MSPIEIEACVIEAKKGCQENLQKILEQFKPYAFKVSRQYNIKNCDVNDNVQLCYVALMNAVEKYREGSNNFKTYAFRTIENALKYNARQNIKYNKDLSFNASIDSNEAPHGEFINLISTGTEVDEHIIKDDSLEEVKTALAKLPEDEKELITMVYYCGVPLKHYGEKKGLSYGQAIRKRKSILDKLKGQLIN